MKRPQSIRKVLSALIKRNRNLEACARWVYARVSGQIHRDPTWLISRAIRGDRATIVQIGSNDGVLGDPLYPLHVCRPGWRCLFVEPVPEVFARLKQIHGSSGRHAFENVAINNGAYESFFYVDPEASKVLGECDGYLSQLGSFNRSHIIRHLGKDFEPYVRELKVQGMSLQSLLDKHGIVKMDILHVDAEAIDWSIVQQLDLNRYRPTVILFEHLHLSAGEIEQARERLSPHCDMLDLGADFFCKSRSGDS